MTITTREMFAGLTGADAALVNDDVNILNDSRFTFAAPLWQILRQGTCQRERKGKIGAQNMNFHAQNA